MSRKTIEFCAMSWVPKTCVGGSGTAPSVEASVRLTDNSQVTKATHLAAREAALLMAEDIPPAMKEVLVKPLSREVRKWTKAVRRLVGFEGGPGSGAGGDDEDEDVEGEAFTQGPLQTLLTQLVKKKKRPAAAAEADPLAMPAGAGPPPKAKRGLFCKSLISDTDLLNKDYYLFKSNVFVL